MRRAHVSLCCSSVGVCVAHTGFPAVTRCYLCVAATAARVVMNSVRGRRINDLSEAVFWENDFTPHCRIFGCGGAAPPGLIREKGDQNRARKRTRLTKCHTSGMRYGGRFSLCETGCRGMQDPHPVRFAYRMGLISGYAGLRHLRCLGVGGGAMIANIGCGGRVAGGCGEHMCRCAAALWGCASRTPGSLRSPGATYVSPLPRRVL